MPTREQVLRAYRERGDYASAAQVLHIPAGQAYLIATGRPADGGDNAPPARTGLARTAPGKVPPAEPLPAEPLPGSTQHLVYGDAAVRNPTASAEVDEWIRQRAAVDGQMREAARTRDALPGEPLEPQVTDIISVLSSQHDQVTALIKQLKAIPGVSKGGSQVHQSRRASIVDMITIALSRHEAAEEEHFWPWVRSVLDDGDEAAAAALEQEKQGKDLLTALGKASPADEAFDELAEEMERAARTHVAFEDRVLLRLRAATSEQDRTAVGERFLQAWKHAPTRPHPHAPQRPGTAVKAAGAAGAVMDRVRDVAGSRPAERGGRETRDDIQAQDDEGTSA